MDKTSRLPGFHKLPRKERVHSIGLDGDDARSLEEGLSLEQAEGMIENVIGVLKLPLGIATNFLINGRDYLIPMAIEEPSVVAAASNAAKIARVGGGFMSESTRQVMLGQIQLLDVDMEKAEGIVLKDKTAILELANLQDSVLVKHGGGAFDVRTRRLETRRGGMLVVYLMVDVRDAMGANAVNTMCEAVSGRIERETGGRSCLRIVSNYATERIAKSKATFDKNALGGCDVVEGILDAHELAVSDIYRTVTHNKGVMNGIDAVALATGNDFRAIEAGAHAYAARSGEYRPLTDYHKDGDGNLVGTIETPMAVGIVGGSVKTNPAAKTSLKILGVKTAGELAGVMAAVGLAQNLAALRALATEGIQKGHMRLHARNIAVTAGASESMVDAVAGEMIKRGCISVSEAKSIMEG
jgi:hydroxymethylglutaryl-CoA reductase